ncbi:MAG: peptide deformylase [Clostridium sp.]|uniref:peptide deformylase n=1 Tax=Clostridium sp. TaxID=1506 RepID=UPI00290CDCF5|nr:peptide deformylase [Clostridium sp.]MDU7337155.1 peptide deformylase [Clostridium sp.]
MAIRNIVQDGDPILNKTCRPVEKFDEKLAILLDDMTETVLAANGAGLAANQVGILRRAIIVVNIEDDSIIELVNPEILESDGEQDGAEGCLSFPGQYGMVKRPNHVKVRAQDRKGNFFEIEGTEFLARTFCHETDHLNGIVFKQRASRILSEDDME